MQQLINKKLEEITGTNTFEKAEVIQRLWSGYGEIVRYNVQGGSMPSLILKHVQMPTKANHPRGWNDSFANARKLKSYQVEQFFYAKYAKQCEEQCRIPKCYSSFSEQKELVMILEDLDASGYPLRLHSVNWTQIKACISWLAQFHAVFMQQKPKGLWSIGSYWHLDTRPNELQAMGNKKLKDAASQIDEKLNSCRFLTYIHGDAKLANFCFGADGREIAVLDFQYIGGGCGMKDLAYFVSSCMYEDECEAYEQEILDHYFTSLKHALGVGFANFEELESEWRTMYHWAWADFARFLDGWSPTHWKLNSYTDKVCKKVLEQVGK